MSAAPLDPFTSRAAGVVYAARLHRRGSDGTSADDFDLLIATAAPPAMPATTMVPATAAAVQPGRADPETEREDLGESAEWKASGYTAVDVVWQTLLEARRPLTKGEVVYAADAVAKKMGRSEGYKARMIGGALAKLKAGLPDGRQVLQDQDKDPYRLPPGTGAEPAVDGEVIAAEVGEDLMMAAELVIRTQFGSTSMLQRKMRIKFTAAGALMDQLEARGIVGPAQGSLPRDVNYHVEQLADALAKCQEPAVAPNT
jgi:DNA segregation ATPase FtsK/SpoIIIE-like protein